MGLTVTFVSGSRGSGKSTLIHRMVERLWKSEPHYIRLAALGSDKRRQKAAEPVPPVRGVASVRWLDYDHDQVFAVLPEALTAIHRHDPQAAVILEADADPVLRHAYPYDHRVFVMPVPDSTELVFRGPHRAATELQRVLDDTAVFASEIFGLFSTPGQEEVDPSEPRPDLTDTQMRGFLHSPFGDELATRIQLQPSYHGLVESDLIVVNTSVGLRGPETAECLRRIEHLLERVRGIKQGRADLFFCGLRDENGKAWRKLLKALAPMCRRSR